MRELIYWTASFMILLLLFLVIPLLGVGIEMFLDWYTGYLDWIWENVKGESR